MFPDKALNLIGIQRLNAVHVLTHTHTGLLSGMPDF
jgi:hypothetical protein